MDGVFMRKLLHLILLCALMVSMLWFGTVISDRQRLNNEVIRLHVVADSDDAEAQALKLKVRDAVTELLKQSLDRIPDVDQAKAYLLDSLEEIRLVAEDTLRQAGCHDPVTVTLNREAFDTRHYDTFSLPAGVYESLRITIGSGEGKNWWCVVFPALCMNAAGESFEDTAAGAGFPDTLTAALEGKEGHELRFFLLDVLGELENLLRFG